MNLKQDIACLYVWESSSTAGKTYQTLQMVDGSLTCDCPAWIFRKKTTASGERTCKHVREVQAGIARGHCLKVVDYAPVSFKNVSPLVRAQLDRTNAPIRNRVITLED